MHCDRLPTIITQWLLLTLQRDGSGRGRCDQSSTKQGQPPPTMPSYMTTPKMLQRPLYGRAWWLLSTTGSAMRHRWLHRWTVRLSLRWFRFHIPILLWYGHPTNQIYNELELPDNLKTEMFPPRSPKLHYVPQE